MNQFVKVITTPQPLRNPLDDEALCQDGLVDQPDLRLDRARRALRGLSALTISETAPDECLMGRRGDLADLIEILRDELEAALTGKRPAL